MSIAFLFPGQNSRYPSMLAKVLTGDRANAEWLDRASAALKRDLRAHYHPDNPEMFARNRDVQIGVFLANHLHWQSLERAGLHAAYSAGLSLGEYNHLVHIGALGFEDALHVLEERGRAYENGPSGKMTAVLSASVCDVERLLSGLDLTRRVGIGMVNTPRQAVLSGEAAAVDRAAAAAEDELGAGTVVIESALPMHSPLYRTIGDTLRPALERAHWHCPNKPYLSNVSGALEYRPGPAVFVDSLARHVWNTVRWRDSIEVLAGAAGVTTFVEAGPKSVLAGLFSRKWVAPQRFSTDAGEDINSTIAEIVAEIANGSHGAAVAG